MRRFFSRSLRRPAMVGLRHEAEFRSVLRFNENRDGPFRAPARPSENRKTQCGTTGRLRTGVSGFVERLPASDHYSIAEKFAFATAVYAETVLEVFDGKGWDGLIRFMRYFA